VANPARFAVERPRVVLLATLLLVVNGVLAYQGLPRQENPTIADRFATVTTYLPGAEPAKVELLVSKVIEDHVAEVDDLREIFSTSSHGVSFLLVQAKRDAPARQRLLEIRDKVQEARARLPEGASDPDVDLRVFRTNTMVLALTGRGVPRLALRQQARELERDLEALGDVRRVDLVGLPEEEIEVAVDLRRLSQRHVPLGRVIDALAARNVRLPSGELAVGAVRSPIRTTGAFDRAEDVGATLLAAGANGHPVRLADVARVRRGLADDTVVVRTDGVPAVALGVEMLPGRNAVALGERVQRLIAEREAVLPEGMAIRVVADEPTYVRERLSLLTGSLLLGMGVVVALSLLGMGWRSGLVVSLTIPLALTVAMGLQGIVGVPLHQISIAALVIAVGIVVDESIVVTDNIQRHLDRGAPPRQAAVRGLGEIHLAVLAGAATTVAAFIPLMVMRGDIGDFIRSIPVVVTLMIMGSVTVAHFVTPLLAVLLNRRGEPGRSPLWARIEPLYAPVADFAVRRRHAVLGLFVLGLLGAGALGAARLWPPAFFPDADRHQFLIRVQLPGGAPVEETDAVLRAIEARLAGDPDLRDWTTFAGSDAPKFYYNEFDDGKAEHRGMVIVNTRERVPFSRTRQVAERIDRDLKAHVPGAFVRARVLKQGYSGGDAIRIFLTGDDLDVLRALAARVREIVEDVPGTRNVWDSFGYDPVTLQARVEPARANLLGISHRDVAETLRTAMDGVVATTLQEDDEEIAIRVELAARERTAVGDLETLPLYSPAAGRAVPLLQVARLEPGWTVRSILRFNRKREASVTADLEPGHTLLGLAADVERAVRARVAFPPGYQAHFLGEHREVTESFLSLLQAAVAALLLIYLVLVLRFGSLAQPLLILLAVPMALAGAGTGLAITGNPLSFMSFLGMISLTGIAVNDSIVLVDTINRLRGEGLALEAAVAQGARLRLRAVLMTSITTIGGLLPLSVGGGAFWAPFGFAMIFGLAGATLLTLVVQPAAYLVLEGRRRRAPA